MTFRSLIVAFATSFFLQVSYAQCDTSCFAADSLQFVTDGTINTITKYADTLYLGGDFRYLGKYTGSFAGVDTVSGNVYNQQTWPKSNGTVYAVASDGSGGFIIAGNFTMVGDSLRKSIAHINSSGQVSVFNPGVAGTVKALLLYNDTLYLGGNFNLIGTTTRLGLAAIAWSSGTLVSGWNPYMAGSGAIINALATDGTNIYLGGKFSSISSTTRPNLASVNKSTGVLNSWNPQLATTSQVNCILIKNNKAYIGGSFSSIGSPSVTRNNLAAIDINTGLATSWNPNVGGDVNCMLISDNKIYIGGNMGTVGTATRTSVAAIDTATGLATSWQHAYYIQPVTSLLLNNNILYAGANAYPATNSVFIERINFIALDTSSGAVLPFTAHANNSIFCMTVYGGKLFLGGSMGSAGGMLRASLAGINLNNNTIINWNPVPSYPVVNDIVIDTNKMYVGGAFGYINSTPRNRMACFDIANGYTLTSFDPLASLFVNSVKTICFTASDIYLGGTFSFTANGAHYGIASFNRSTGIANSFAPSGFGSSSRVNKIKVQGNLVYIASNSSASLKVYNTATGNETNLFFSGTHEGHDIALISNKVFAGGDLDYYTVGTTFYHCYGIPAFTLPALTLSGWTAPVASNPTVLSLTIQKGRMYVSGSSLFSGREVAILDTVLGSLISKWNPSFSDAVNKILPLGDTLFAAGAFTSIDGKNYSGLVRMHLNTPLLLPQITTATTTVCASTSTTINCNAPSGSSYQWVKNGSTVSGATISAYTFTAVNGDSIVCIVTPPATGCYVNTAVVSNPLVFSVTANTTSTASITASPSGTVCAGTTVTYTCVSNITGGSYQWKVGTTSVGTNSSTYAYTPSNGDAITCEVTKVSGTCFAPSPKTSNTITASVTTNVTPTASISASPSGTVCAGTTVTYTCTSNLTGGSYQWKVGTASVGTNSSTYSYIPANGDLITCEVTKAPGSCYAPSSVISNTITASVTANTTPTASISASPSGTVCAGTAITYTCTSNLTGGSYQWKAGTTNIGTNSSTCTYTPANGDVITCEVTKAVGSCFAPSVVTSNSVVASVTANTPSSVAIIASPSGPVCVGTSVTYTCTTNLSGAPYQWKVGTANVGTNSNTYTYIPASGDVVTCEVTKIAGTCYSPSPAISNSVVAAITAKTVPSISITGPLTATIGTPVTVNAALSNSGSSYSINWYKNGSMITGTSVPVWTYTKTAGTDNIKAVIKPTGCYDTAVSNTIIISESVVGIEGMSINDGIKVYPNPFDDEISITGLQAGDELALYDIIGRKILFVTIAESQVYKLATGNLDKAAYVLKIMGKNGAMRKSILIQKK